MKTFVNLLPFGYRRRDLFRARLVQWCLVWLACATVATGTWQVKRSRYLSSLRAMEAAQSRYLPLAELSRQRDAARKELDRLHAKGTILEQLRDEKPILTLMGVVSDSARKCKGRLFVNDLSFERHERRTETARPQSRKSKGESPPPAAKKAEPWATVTFKGDALDNLAIATFAAGLRDAGLFRRVELKSSVGKKASLPAVRSFVVECDI